MSVVIRRNIFGALAAISLASPAWAHDFWLQPNNYKVTPNSLDLVTIQVGHGKDRQRWAGGVDRVVMLRSIGPHGAVDERAGIRANNPAEDAEISFPSPGTYILAFESTHAASNLPSIRFNSYIQAEGLTPAIRYREQTKAGDMPGREIYSRRAKALIQVGDPGSTPQPQITKPIGLTLEIVPERNPYTLPAKDALPVQVLYQGHPLAGALVKLTNLEFDQRPLEMHLSDQDGRASFSFPRTGTWLINVIWTQPIQGNPAADFDTTFSSLTFAFPPGLRPH